MTGTFYTAKLQPDEAEKVMNDLASRGFGCIAVRDRDVIQVLSNGLIGGALPLAGDVAEVLARQMLGSGAKWAGPWSDDIRAAWSRFTLGANPWQPTTPELRS